MKYKKGDWVIIERFFFKRNVVINDTTINGKYLVGEYEWHDIGNRYKYCYLIDESKIIDKFKN